MLHQDMEKFAFARKTTGQKVGKKVRLPGIFTGRNGVKPNPDKQEKTLRF